MPTWVIIVTALVLAAIFVAVDRRHAWLWRRWARWDNDRYDLRLRVGGIPGELVLVGTADSDGVVTVCDGGLTFADKSVERVAISGGQRLAVERLPELEREETGSVRLPVGTTFWVLDAPFLKLERDEPAGVVRLPSRETYTVRGGDPTMPSDVDVQARSTWWAIVVLVAVAAVAGIDPKWSSFPAAWALVVPVGLVALRLAIRIAGLGAVPRVPEGAHVPGSALSTTLGTTERPVWLSTLARPEAWLFETKRSAEPSVLFVDLVDPHRAAREAVPRDRVVDGLADLFSEAVWLSTDVGACSATPVVFGRAVIRLTGEPITWESLAGWLASYSGRRLVVWGETRKNLEREGCVLHLRLTEPADAPERVVTGTFPELVEQLIAFLEEHDLGARREVPRDLPLPWQVGDYTLVASWSAMLAARTRLAMSDFSVRALDAITEEEGRRAFDAALGFAEAHGAVLPQARAMLLSTAVELEGQKCLDDERKAKARATLDALVAERHRLARLAPVVLLKLGDAAAAAAAARKDLAAGSTAAYREWNDPHVAWLRSIAAAAEDRVAADDDRGDPVAP